ncbi:MAG: pilus assembly protein PilM [Neisseriaceae bacterium]
MFKKFFGGHLRAGATQENQVPYSVGVSFDDFSMSYVLLKRWDDFVQLDSYRSVLLKSGVVSNGKIIEMDDLASTLIGLARDFSRYTDQLVLSLPQPLVTMEYFDYRVEEGHSMESEAEFRAGKVADLSEITFDYFMCGEPETKNNMLLAMAKLTDVESRAYLVEVSDLTLRCLDVEAVALVNAFSCWINRSLPEAEEELIAVYHIGLYSTQVVFSRRGKILYANELPVGIVQLFSSMPEYSNWQGTELHKLVYEELYFDRHAEEAIEPLVQEINRSVGLFSAHEHTLGADETSEVERIFLTGIGAKNPVIEKKLQELLSVPVSVLNPVEVAQKGTKEPLKNDAFALTIPFGLALRGFL